MGSWHCPWVARGPVGPWASRVIKPGPGYPEAGPAYAKNRPAPGRGWPRLPESRPRPRCPQARPPPTPAATAPPETAPALKGGRHPAVLPFLGRVTRKPAAGPRRAPFLRALGPCLGAGPGWARSGVRFGFPTKGFVRRVEETSSRPRRPAWGAARGTQRTPPAPQARGGPATTTAAPVAPAARESRADRRAGLPGSARPSLRGLTRKRSRPSRRGVTRSRSRPRVSRIARKRPPPKSERRYPEARRRRPGRGCPQAPGPTQPSPSRVTRKPPGPRRTNQPIPPFLQLAARGRR